MFKSLYLLGILLATLFSWGAWIVVLTRLSPFGSEKEFALILFFISFFFAVTGTLTLLGYFVRVYILHNQMYFNHLITSLRQGVFLGLFACTALVFERYHVFTWWNALLLFLSFALLEVYFLSKKLV